MDQKQEAVLQILRSFNDSDFESLHVEYEGIVVTVSRAAGGLPPPDRTAGGPAPSVEAPTPSRGQEPPRDATREAARHGLHEVRAPMLGTFYRAPGPGQAPFVEVGSEIGADDTICLIECMKLFNTIPAGVKGRIHSFLVEDGGFVEFDQPMALLEQA